VTFVASQSHRRAGVSLKSPALRMYPTHSPNSAVGFLVNRSPTRTERMAEDVLRCRVYPHHVGESSSTGTCRDCGFHDTDFPAVMHNHNRVALDVLDGCAQVFLATDQPDVHLGRLPPRHVQKHINFHEWLGLRLRRLGVGLLTTIRTCDAGLVLTRLRLRPTSHVSLD
jgi:hypothetical protein